MVGVEEVVVADVAEVDVVLEAGGGVADRAEPEGGERRRRRRTAGRTSSVRAARRSARPPACGSRRARRRSRSAGSGPTAAARRRRVGRGVVGMGVAVGGGGRRGWRRRRASAWAWPSVAAAWPGRRRSSAWAWPSAAVASSPWVCSAPAALVACPSSWLCTCVPPYIMATTVSAPIATAGTPRRDAAGRVCPRSERPRAAAAATAPRAAHAVSANCGRLRLLEPFDPRDPRDPRDGPGGDGPAVDERGGASGGPAALDAASRARPRTAPRRRRRTAGRAWRARRGCRSAAAWIAPAPSDASPASCVALIQPERFAAARRRPAAAVVVGPVVCHRCALSWPPASDGVPTLRPSCRHHGSDQPWSARRTGAAHSGRQTRKSGSQGSRPL